MDIFDKLVDFKKDLLEAQLKVVNRYQRKDPERKQKMKRTSKLDTVEDILSAAGEPLHISRIIEIAGEDHDVALERDSIVSALTKKIKAGNRFAKTAPNTFSLKN